MFLLFSVLCWSSVLTCLVALSISSLCLLLCNCLPLPDLLHLCSIISHLSHCLLIRYFGFLLVLFFSWLALFFSWLAQFGGFKLTFCSLPACLCVLCLGPMLCNLTVRSVITWKTNLCTNGKILSSKRWKAVRWGCKLLLKLWAFLELFVSFWFHEVMCIY